MSSCPPSIAAESQERPDSDSWRLEILRESYAATATVLDEAGVPRRVAGKLLSMAERVALALRQARDKPVPPVAPTTAQEGARCDDEARGRDWRFLGDVAGLREALDVTGQAYDAMEAERDRLRDLLDALVSGPSGAADGDERAFWCLVEEEP